MNGRDERKGLIMQPKYPDIEVQLTGQDGNAFAVLGRVMRAMRKAGIDREEIDRFQTEATSGDYDQLLGTVMRWVDAR